jgi:hypothetical protein
MKLEYELIEDSFDDTTHIRTMSEQAKVKEAGWLLRTTVYSPHHISVNVTFVPGKDDKLFGPIVD